MKTVCKWMVDDEMLLVNPDGQVLPCCYLSNFFTTKNNEIKEPNTWEWDPMTDQLYHFDRANHNLHNEYVYKEYQKRKDKLNIFTNDLETILNDEWFTKILPESWESDDTILNACKKVCTK